MCMTLVRTYDIIDLNEFSTIRMAALTASLSNSILIAGPAVIVR